MKHGPEKSDAAIRARKPANKAARVAAEPVEQRAATEGNTGQPRTQRTQGRASVSPGLDRVRNAAKQRKKEKFPALLHHLTVAIPPPHVQDAIGRRLSGRRLQQLETVFLLRSTAQQVENAVSDWLGGTAGSPARFQTLILLWAAGGRPLPHQEIIAALRVKRATVSALMFSLEQDGLVQSVPDRQDRRRLLATLTNKGEKVATDAIDLNAARLEQVMHGLSPEELEVLQRLLRQVREDFAHPRRDEKRADSAL